ncbi:MAG: glycosyltransferase family 2 protein, partial [Gammaproteobacteria bacterium]
LSHDQLEAVLMRRAGYEVRVLPDEEGSWEENPPDLLEFMRRDLRWCQGNMQYFHFLGMSELHPVSRFQLVLAIAMYLGSPAWLAFILLGLIRGPVFHLELGIVLFFLMLAMTFAPKLATLADVLARRDLRRAYGGAARIALGAALEIDFSMLRAPVIAVAVTVFVLRLPFGRRSGWAEQRRDVQHLTLAAAARKLWPQTLAGAALVAWFWHAAPGLIWFWLPIFAGLVGAVPFAMVTAHPAVGRALSARGICRIPEESSPPLAAPARLLAPYPAASLKAAE